MRLYSIQNTDQKKKKKKKERKKFAEKDIAQAENHPCRNSLMNGVSRSYLHECALSLSKRTMNKWTYGGV